MKKNILVVCLLLFGFAALAAVPHYLTYQGVLRDSSGNLVTGTKSMSFSIFNVLTGGSAVYGPQTETSVSVSNGNYTVQLGLITTPTTVFDGADKYLEVSVDGTPLSPRLKINSVAYSMRAENADTATTATTVSDGSITAAKISSEAVTGPKIAGLAIDGTKLSNSITINTSGGITTSNTITANQLTVTKIATTGAGCVGKWSIINGSAISTPVVNPNIGDNSMIFITPLTENAGLTYEALVPININTPISGQFNVRTANRQVVPETIYFNYLIIN